MRAFPIFRALAATVVLFTAISLAGCKSDEPVQPTKTQLSAIDIGYSRLRISLPVFVAQEKGLFEKHGISANLLVYDTAQPMMQALVEGKIDVAGYSALIITYGAMARSGKQLYFLTTMVEDQGHRISYLLRPKPLDGVAPEINKISDLKGKTIGILPTTAYKAWIGMILKANGLDPEKDVVIQPVAPEQQPQTLKNGGVHALFTNDPAATSVIALGIGELISNEVEVPKYLGEPFPFGSFNVSKDWGDKHPREFKALTAALDEAVAFTNQNPAEAKEIMRKYLPEKFQSHVSLYPDAKYLSTTDSKSKDFTDAADQYLSAGIIDKAVYLTDLIITK